MKKVLMFIACFFTAVLLFLSCSKDKQPNPPTVAVNKPPIAIAGDDGTLTLSSCTAKFIVPLDGRNSSDPGGKIISFSWRSISGRPQDFTLRSDNSSYASVEIRKGGVYTFELLVGDNGNLTSRDTVSITVLGATPKEYDLDLTSNTTYTFVDNYKEDDYQPISYYDYTYIQGSGTFDPIGLLNISLYEKTDTVALSYKTSSLNISYDNYTTNVYGSTSINFKKLIQQGGGAFNGNFNITNGSANGCDPDIYKSLAPLLVTGSLDTTTKRVSIRIKGKTFF